MPLPLPLRTHHRPLRRCFDPPLSPSVSARKENSGGKARSKKKSQDFGAISGQERKAFFSLDSCFPPSITLNSLLLLLLLQIRARRQGVSWARTVSWIRRRSPGGGGGWPALRWPEWRMVLVDLRNHGRSAGIKGLSPPHDMSTSARDLTDLVKARGWTWPDVVVGHSMGGKVALDFAESCSHGDYGESTVLLKQLWVLDSVPGQVETDSSDGEVERVLQTLASIWSSSLSSRKWVVDHMLSLGFSKSLSEWIGSNLKKDNEQVTWAFELQAAIGMFNSYRERSYWTLLEHPPKGLEIAIVQAEGSDRWHPDDVQRLKELSRRGSKPDSRKLSPHVLPNSGRWVHVDNPKGLLEIMAHNFLSTVQN